MYPQTSKELTYFTFIIFIGAFVEAYIIGGIVAELGKA